MSFVDGSDRRGFGSFLSVEAFEPRAFHQVPANGGKGELGAGFDQSQEAGSRHAPEAFQVAEYGLNPTSGHADCDVSRLARRAQGMPARAASLHPVGDANTATPT